MVIGVTLVMAVLGSPAALRNCSPVGREVECFNLKRSQTCPSERGFLIRKRLKQDRFGMRNREGLRVLEVSASPVLRIHAGGHPRRYGLRAVLYD